MEIIISFVVGALVGFVCGLLVMYKHKARVEAVKNAVEGK